MRRIIKCLQNEGRYYNVYYVNGAVAGLMPSPVTSNLLALVRPPTPVDTLSAMPPHTVCYLIPVHFRRAILMAITLDIDKQGLDGLHWTL